MHLSIKNFICIKEAEVEFDDFTVFIGEQGAGKSLIAKLYFFIRRILPEDIDKGLLRKTETQMHDLLEEKFNKIFPSYAWNTHSFNIQIKYKIEKYNEESKQIEINISYKKGKDIKFEFSDYLEYMQKEF